LGGIFKWFIYKSGAKKHSFLVNEIHMK